VTQDFVMANGPAFVAPDAKAFLGGLKLLAATTDKVEGGKMALSAALRGVGSALKAVGAAAMSAFRAEHNGYPNSEPRSAVGLSGNPASAVGTTPGREGFWNARRRPKPAGIGMRAMAGAVGGLTGGAGVSDDAAQGGSQGRADRHVAAQTQGCPTARVRD